jgi:glutamine synthetase
MPPLQTAHPSPHRISSLDHATAEDLTQFVQTFPVIDNHAHNMLHEDYAYGNTEAPFECITSEAQGPALLDHAHSSLSQMRAIKDLARFYQCPETMADVKAARYEWVRRDYPGLIEKCLEGTHAIMMDDGLNTDVVYPYKWHRQFAPTVSRIVRIEAIATDILQQLVLAAGLSKLGRDPEWERNQTEALFIRFNGEFRNQIRAFANDPDVRGFKSVVCYRTGLDVGLSSRKILRPQHSLTESDLLSAFHDFLQSAVRTGNYRIGKKEVNDYLVVAVCDVLDKRVHGEGEGIPFQFHTGLGDSDIDLVKANPAYMQPLIEAFPNVDFVLLHSSYPYTREAGYLASAYANAWLDIGEVFPMLSRDGKEMVLKQTLELAPTSKILWSTDGHYFPESYWLANKQFREVLQKVLTAGVSAGDYSAGQAVNMAADIMFWNSNTLYNLNEEKKYPHLWEACGRPTSNGSLKTLANGSSCTQSLKSNTSKSTLVAASSSTSSSGTRATRSISTETTSAPAQSTATSSASLALLDTFLAENSSVKYVWIQFLDYTATLRVRMVPIKQFRMMVATSTFIGVTLGLLHLLQDDNVAPGGTATGQWLLSPDPTTLCLNKGLSSSSATVQTWWMEDVPNNTKHLEGCPRWTLQRQVDALVSEFGISILMGFEVEIIFMRPVFDAETSTFTEFLPLHTVHSWSNMTYQQLEALPMVEEMVAALAEIDIHLPQFHAEAAPGQWEFPMPVNEPLKAVDTLYKARSVIQNIAKNYGYKATLYPRPYNFTCGSASHAHISINGPGDTVAKYADPFLAGVLKHLPSILAFTLPLEESYARVLAGIWSGGEWVTWGTQNREAPLRKCGEGHWELKMVDGIANMYLGMAAVLSSGLAGLKEELQLEHKDCDTSAAGLSDAERRALGITTPLPKNLKQSLAALGKDVVLKEALGETFIGNYIAVKEAEMKKLEGFGDKKRRLWLMERY